MGDFYDEAYEDAGEPRAHYRAVLDALGAADLAELAEELRGEVRERGVRYGSTGPGEFVVDAVPRLFTREEWDGLARGLEQRMRALDAFLRDAYGEREIVDAGRSRLRLIEDGEFYEPDMQGSSSRCGRASPGSTSSATPPASSACWRTTCGCRPGSASRRWPGSWSASCSARRLPEREPADPDAALERFAAILRAAAPGGDGDPSMVVLGDGFENDAQWEISEVAFRMGLPMVTLDDLSARDGRAVRARRRAGAARSTSSTGARTTTCCATRTAGRARSPTSCSSRCGAARVAVVNPPGVGIADDKLAHVYVPEMIRFYLGEEPLLASAPTPTT